MTSFYSLVQFVRDPLADERVNLGVVVVDDTGQTASRFLFDTSRAARLAGGAYTSAIMRGLVRDVDVTLNHEVETGGLPALEALSNGWINDVRITVPRASTLSAAALLDSIVHRVLVESAQPDRSRSSRSAIRLGREAIADALSAQVDGGLSLKMGVTVVGKTEPHIVDFGIFNGQLRLGVTGLSFEGPWSRDRQRGVDAVKWFVNDTLAAPTSAELAVVTLPPNQPTSREAYEDAVEVFGQLGAAVVLEDAIEDWAQNSVRQLVHV